jgi:sulfur relay (sulfurtransferase) complex TusBCD TusD component (DsrE family)
MGVGYRPDFIVTSVTGPASAQPGQQVTAQVQVCNQGTQDGSADLEVYLSADDVITPSGGPPPMQDYPIGWASVPWLMAGQCTTVTVNGNAYPPPPGNEGPYYLGAYVDPWNYQMELIEDNNANSGYRMGVGYRPDFIVTSVTGPASAYPGQQVTAQVQVCNQGTQDGSADLEIYLSADAVITPPNGPPPPQDYPIGWASVPWLMAGQCTTVTVSGYAYPPPPGNEGPYYLGAYVDPWNNQMELIEDNNANSGYRIGVGYRPDFIVTSVTGPASAYPGQQVTAQVQVCNQGTMGDSTDVEVYLSADAVITPNGSQPSPDSWVGWAPVPYLMAGQCTTVVVNGYVYPPPPGSYGPYYLGAVADPWNYQMELIEDNNTGSTPISIVP